MRKKYEKPVLMVENFNMDIDILAGDSLADLKADYEFDCMVWGEEATDAGFEAWLLKNHPDMATSGYCYYTVRGMS